jgi:hypothetical protein
MSDTAAGSNTPDPDQPAPGTGDPAAVGTKGGGEWPSKDAPPTGAAPGSDPERAAELKAERREHTTAGDGTSAGELHPATRLASPYEQRPDQAAVGSTPLDADRAADASAAIEDASAADEAPASDAGAARDRGERPIGAPTTELA